MSFYANCFVCSTQLGKIKEDYEEYFIDSCHCACGKLKFCKYGDCCKSPQIKEAFGLYFCDECLMKDRGFGFCTVAGCKFPLFSQPPGMRGNRYFKHRSICFNGHKHRLPKGYRTMDYRKPLVYKFYEEGV